jgi:RsmE family RNA methyltransferase
VNIILFEENEFGHNLSRSDERTIHLLKVLHKKIGDTFEAGIIDGMRGAGKIEKINFDGSIFVSVNAGEPPPPRLCLRMAVAFVRPIQLKRILRDLSNIGVSSIDIISAELGEKSYRSTKLFNEGGAHTALLEGAVQARDTRLPALEVYESLDNWLTARPWEKTEKRIPLLFSMDNVKPEGSFFNISPSIRPAVIAVGPERGWSDRERELFEKSGFHRLSIGNRALRTETACVVSAALAMEKTWEGI